MGHLAVTNDPRDTSKNDDPFDQWPMTHDWPISISGAWGPYRNLVSRDVTGDPVVRFRSRFN